MRPRFHITITPEVYDDLAEIHAHVAADSPDRAADLIRAIVDRIDALDTMPTASPRHSVQRSTRLPVYVTHEHSFMIYYSVLESPPSVTVLHVRHGARRQPRRFE